MKIEFNLPRVALLFVMVVALIIGYFIAPDYGISWDELGIYRYSSQMLAAYPFILHPQDFEAKVSDPLLYLYGPAHFMASTVFSRFILTFQTSWSFFTAYHFFYFVTFLFGVLALYFLSIRWMSEWAAFGVAVLFATQPLFWGNAFINPKDTPFMTFFIASVYFGFQMLDDSSSSRWWKTFLAGIVLGITTSVRSLGPMAGALVILYGLWKSPRKTLTLAPLYVLVAMAVAYLSWPYLWSAPVSHFMETLQTMSKFPNTGETLFNGNLYPADQLPLTYFPTFIALQLTEPMLALIVIGTVISTWLFVKAQDREPVLLFVAWFLLPALYIGSSGSTLYDNARQLIFLLPPLLIFAGVGLDVLLKYIKTPVLRAVLMLVMVLPGLYANIQLHPYQFVYFNSLTGGVGGAFRKFDLDYTGTSFMEAQEYLNANAEPGVQIVVVGPRHIARAYAREDLKNSFIGTQDSLNPDGLDYYYVLFLTRTNADLSRCMDGEIVYTVERDGGVLAYIKKITSKQECW